jgi:glutathione S-transferase
MRIPPGPPGYAPAPVRRLVTIPISHYCEKARWALERAGLQYVEERHVQGIHRIVARRAGGGSTVPVLVAPEGVFAESEQILAYADASLPEHLRLFPADPVLRGEVSALSRWLDEGLGPEGRRVMYSHMLKQRRLMLSFNCQGVPAWERRAMTALWPVIVPWAKRELGIEPARVDQDEAQVWRAFETVADRLADGRRHLCGDRFTAADLTFAALSAAVLVPPQYGVPLPQPDVLPPYLASKVQAFREHPAGAYALSLFRGERHKRVETGGAISSASAEASTRA